MLKSLKFLVLLATVSYGYTSNINQNNLKEIDTNTNNINNLMQNNNINNNEQNNIQYLRKKTKSKQVENKEENEAYKYLFSDDNDNKYFPFPNGPAEVSNPEYRQFMENLYDLFHNCLYNLFSNYDPTYEKNINYNKMNRLTKIKVNINLVKEVARSFNFKFSDRNNYIFANNNLINFTMYTINNKDEIQKDGISFYDLYVSYLYNHIVKLYNQTTHALQKSIDNHEQTNKQVEIVNEFCNTLNKVLYEISRQIEKEEYKISVKNKNSIGKYRELLNDISNNIEEYTDNTLNQKVKEFNWYNKDFQKQFDAIHNDAIKPWLEKLIESNEVQNSIINTMNNQELVNSNLQLFDELLNGLNIEIIMM